MTDITVYGAKGDGVTDCSPALREALKNEKEIYVPEGRYKITEELRLPSGIKLTAHKNATIFCADGCFTAEGSRAMVTNDDYENGNSAIYIEGGVWDGNNTANPRTDGWRDGPSQGLLFSFFNVRGLTIKNLTAKDSESYHFRLGKTSDFLLENIIISDTAFTACQDGFHIGGGCSGGIIRGIRAEKGSTNDDLIAFNADDANWYCHNWGMTDAPISDMLVEDVYAEDCWTAIRLLSVKTEIRDITIRNVTAGVREMGINLDNTRYAGDLIFNPDEYPDGVGNLNNVRFENITLWRTSDRPKPLIVAESNGKNIIYSRIKRLRKLEPKNGMPTFRFNHLAESELSLDGRSIRLPADNEFILNCDEAKEIIFNKSETKKKFT